MNLVVDLGNTQCKVSVFQGSTQMYQTQASSISTISWQYIFNEFTISKAIISDTRGNGFKELRPLLPPELNLIELNELVKIPLTINYITPQTLGKDRIAAAVAAFHLYKGFPLLIIDIGTAITIDFVDQKGVFEGGIISPGPELRYKSLHDYTGKLPLLGLVQEVELTPKSTKTAIEGGVQNGIVFEINGYVQKYALKYPTLQVILTGGYTPFFLNSIQGTPKIDIQLVMKGLNQILEHQ